MPNKTPPYLYRSYSITTIVRPYDRMSGLGENANFLAAI